MLRISSLGVAVFFCFLFASPGLVGASPQYTVQGLVGGYANGMNDKGQVIIHTNHIAGGWASYLYTPGQGYEYVVFGGISSVNNVGQAVGQAGGYDAYLWSHDQGIRALPGIDGGISAAAYKINNAGNIVGVARDASDALRPVRWDGPDTVIDLTTLPGWYSAGVEGVLGAGLPLINDLGLMAGTAWVTELGWHGALFDGNRWIFLGSLLPGSGESTPLAMNNRGQVVGASPTAPGGWYPHPFFWSEENIHDLGLLPGYAAGEARGINEAGQIVGVCYKTVDAYGGYDPVAVLWSARGGPTPLKTLVANPPEGLELTYALAINNVGQILAKGSTSTAGDIIFVLTPVRSSMMPALRLLLDVSPLPEACP